MGKIKKYAKLAALETWLSGLKRHRAKVLGSKGPREFESHRLRFYNDTTKIAKAI